MFVRKSLHHCRFRGPFCLSEATKFSVLSRCVSSSPSSSTPSSSSPPRSDLKERLKAGFGIKNDRSTPTPASPKPQDPRLESLEDLSPELGMVVNVSKGVVSVAGVDNARVGAVIAFDTDEGMLNGIVMKIESRMLSVVLLSEGNVIVGDKAVLFEDSLSVSCGEGYAGRVVNALGAPIDGKGEIQGLCYEAYPFKQHVPTIPERMPIAKTLRTGIKHIDFLHPIARGLRIGMFGGPNTGRIELITDIVSNLQYSTEINSQTGKPEQLHVIYVLIGQSSHQLSRLQQHLEKTGAMKYSTIVCGLASDPAALQYVAPWTAALLANFYRDTGRHAVIVYDDFANHARVYRSMCNFSGHPAITNSHAWLLEHSAQLDNARGGGSCTALVPLETETEASSEGYRDQLSSFLDHVILLDGASILANSWPPLDCRSYLGRPPSRFLPVLFRGLRIALNERLRQSEATANHFSWARSFGVDQSDEVDMAVVSYRDRVQELLVQPRGAFVSTAHLLVVLTAAIEGLPELDQIPAFENDLIAEFQKQYPELDASLNKLKWEEEIPADLRAELTLAVRKLSERWDVQRVRVALD